MVLQQSVSLRQIQIDVVKIPIYKKKVFMMILVFIIPLMSFISKKELTYQESNVGCINE